MRAGDIRYDPISGQSMEFVELNRKGMAVFRDIGTKEPSFTVCQPETLDYRPRHIFARAPEQRKVRFAYETYPQYREPLVVVGV